MFYAHGKYYSILHCYRRKRDVDMLACRPMWKSINMREKL